MTWGNNNDDDTATSSNGGSVEHSSGGGNRYNNNSGGSSGECYNSGGGNRNWGNNNNNSNSGGSNGGGYNSGGGNRNWNNNRGNSNYPSNKGGFQKSNYRKNDEDDGPIVLYKPYVGTGNREAPQDILDTIKRLAGELETFGFILRSGGFDGPEDTFEKATTKQEIHLPWRDFNQKQSKFTFNTKQALGIAKMFHPNFDGLKPAIQAFLAKNARMVLGKDVKSPALFVLCWSEDGAESKKETTSRTGNIGHVIAIASALKIPIFNLGKHDAEIRLKKYLELNNGKEQELSEI